MTFFMFGLIKIRLIKLKLMKFYAEGVNFSAKF